jgi:hypothetical protein
MWSPTENSEELYHHGIMGMQWGKQNGPPYPIREGDHSIAEKRAMRKAARQERIAARKAKKKMKHDLKVQKKAAKAEHKRQEILRKGDAKAVAKLKGNISNAEYDEVFKRLINERRLDELTSSQLKEVSSKINAVKNMLSNVKSASDAAIDFYNNGADVYNTIMAVKGQTKRMTPVLRTKRKDEKKKKKNQNDDDDD